MMTSYYEFRNDFETNMLFYRSPQDVLERIVPIYAIMFLFNLQTVLIRIY